MPRIGPRAHTGSRRNFRELTQHPDFLTRSKAQIPEGVVSRLPAVDDVSIPVQTQLIVELCSR